MVPVNMRPSVIAASVFCGSSCSSSSRAFSPFGVSPRNAPSLLHGWDERIDTRGARCKDSRKNPFVGAARVAQASEPPGGLACTHALLRWDAACTGQVQLGDACAIRLAVLESGEQNTT